MLTAAAIEGKFDTRADDCKTLMALIARWLREYNGTLDVVVDKLNWYMSIIDAVPSPIHVIDKDMKWVFLNKAFEKLMVDNGIIRNRHGSAGHALLVGKGQYLQDGELRPRAVEQGQRRDVLRLEWAEMQAGVLEADQPQRASTSASLKWYRTSPPSWP